MRCTRIRIPRTIHDDNEGGRPEQKGGVSMLIVCVHLDASLPAWSSLERQAIILHLLSPHYTPTFLSISVLPHCLVSALFLLRALQYHLSPPFPPVSSSSEYSSATLRMPFSQNIRYICFPLPGFREQDRLHAKCWCEAFLVIITSLGLQENSKLRFNSLLHSKEALLCYCRGY